MRLAFVHDDHPGHVDIEVVRNTDPVAYGCWPHSLDLPICSARVTYDGLGYHAMLGWVQLVRSTDDASGGARFEMDPFVLFEDVDSPYCFYGHAPTLFDGPARTDRNDLTWLAHSFLAATPLREGIPRRVVPLVGFSWGFSFVGGAVIIAEPEVLGAAAWATHLHYLAETYPSWIFDSGAGLP
jgi:hypothetical protein